MGAASERGRSGRYDARCSPAVILGCCPKRGKADFMNCFPVDCVNRCLCLSFHSSRRPTQLDLFGNARRLYRHYCVQPLIPHYGTKIQNVTCWRLTHCTRLSDARLWLGIVRSSGCTAVLGRHPNISAALRMLPPAPCIMAVSAAEETVSALSLTPPVYPAPIVYDLSSLQRWRGCDGAHVPSSKVACIAAVQMLLLESCSAMVGSFKRYQVFV